MRLGITARLFLAFLAGSLLIVLAMGVASRLSFTRGFIGYLNEQGIARVETLVPDFATAYAAHGSWDFLCNNPRAWFNLIRPRPPREPGQPEPPRRVLSDSDLTGLALRLALFDADHALVFGNAKVPRDAEQRPVVVAGRTVGWLAVLPFEGATAAADVRFQQRQLRAGWTIGIASALFAALFAWLIARTLLAPVKRLADATQRLAAGDYATRVPVTSGDEIGRLARDFNGLAVTLEQNERMRRDFMADVSHELRTPLSVLRGELEAIEDGVRPLTPASVQSLQHEVSTLTKLVDDLYDLSLADLGALTFRRTQMDLVELLQGCVAMAADRFRQRGIAVETDFAAAPLTLVADEDRLRQLVTNLLENSLRYTDPGGRLRIACRRGAAGVAIVDVQDSAPGVAPELVPRLFERFYRVEGSRNRASGGAGLGLAICRSIAEAHGGAIVAKPSPLGGVWIELTLPAGEVPA